MNADPLKMVRENLGRVKVYYLRNDSLRALNSMLLGIKEACRVATLPTDIRGLIREAAQTISRDENLKAVLRAPLSYTPGQERQLLAAVADLFKRYMEETQREDHDAALARKQKLDHAFNQGVKLLEQKQISEADASFAEAVNYYKDEHRLFLMIGKALMDAGEVRRAIPYLKRGTEVDSEDKECLMALNTAVEMKQNLGE